MPIKRMARICREIFLAGWEIGRHVNLCPQPVGNRLIGFLPAMQLAGCVSAYLKPHPASTVVINAIHVVICVIGAVFRADHRVPGVGQVVPAFTTFCEPDEDWAYGTASVGKWSILVGQQYGNPLKVI